MQPREYGQQVSRSLADQIQALRLDRGWSLEELAERAGLHRTSVGLIVRGERSMTVATGAALCQALGVQMSALLRAAEDALTPD